VFQKACTKLGGNQFQKEKKQMSETAVLEKKKNVIHTLDTTGDTRLMWDADNEDEVEAAKKMFNDLRAKHYTAYKATGKDGSKGDIITKFDPSAERIIMVPRMVGG
jgi:formate-dependent nitrite reductase cytochrome c552 subunit